MEQNIIGIDPGKNGGIAVIDRNGSVIEVVKMPPTPHDVFMFLNKYKENSICYLERVGGMPGNSANAMFVFGRGYGQLEMALLALEIPTITVTPNKWEKHFQLGKKRDCDTKTEWKNRLKEKAQQLFPYISKKITLCISDALLLAEYGRLEQKI